MPSIKKTSTLFADVCSWIKYLYLYKNNYKLIHWVAPMMPQRAMHRSFISFLTFIFLVWHNKMSETCFIQFYCSYSPGYNKFQLYISAYKWNFSFVFHAIRRTFCRHASLCLLFMFWLWRHRARGLYSRITYWNNNYSIT